MDDFQQLFRLPQQIPQSPFSGMQFPQLQNPGLQQMFQDPWGQFRQRQQQAQTAHPWNPQALMAALQRYVSRPEPGPSPFAPAPHPMMRREDLYRFGGQQPGVTPPANQLTQFDPKVGPQ